MSGISPGFDLMFYLDRSILAEIQANLKDMGSLNAINAKDFCFVVLKWLCLRWNHWSIDDAAINLICRVFECVDVDSRGVICWEDFNAFCLRVGRNQFKPTFRHSALEYTQRFAYSVHVPARRLLYVPSTQMLYAYDGDLASVSIIGRDGRLLGRFNPTTAIIRLLRLQETGRQTYYFKKQHAAAAAAAKKRALALTSQKGLITCMTYIERKRQLVFCTSNGFLSFWDSTVGCLIGFVRTGSAQIGICLSPQADAVVTWPGEVDDTAYRVWDINSRKLRCQAVKHNGRALALLEIAHHRCMVSSTLDREVVMWPISQLKKIQFSSAKNTYLHGHHHAINRLVYAPDHDLLLGSGFDYDVYVWDMASKLLIMCLTGHRCSIVSVVLVYTPFEHAVSVDDGGTVKVWNIDLADNKHAEVLQTIVLTRDSPSQPVLDATLARANGSTLAVLGDSLYMVDLLSGAGSNETKPVSMGLGICEACDSVYVVTNRVLGSGTLSSGGRMRRYLYMDDDRVENATGVHLSLNRETMGLLGNDGASHLDAEIDGDAESQSGPVLMATRRLRRHEKEGTSSDKLDHMRAQILNSLIDPKDDISATAQDPTGKKLFVGTTGGKIFIYDTASFGLLTQIKAEIPTTKAHGAVVALEYIPQDELLVASYAAGAVRVLLGCHRTAEEAEVAIARSTTAMAEAKKVMAAKEHEHDNRLMNRPGSPDSPGAAHSSSVGGMSAVLSMINCPLPVGGKPHPHPVLIRRNDSVQEQMIMAMAVSREYGLIAVSGDDGSVRLVDYFSMRAVGVLCAPLIDDKPVECSHLAFAPHVPVLFGADLEGRITSWTVRPMEFAWVFTWPADYNFAVPRTSTTNVRQEFEDAEVVDEDAQLPGLSKGSDMCGSGVPITCMHCCMYMEPPAEVGLETAKVTSGQRNRFSSAGGTSASSHDQFAELLEDYSYKWVLVCGDQQGRVFEFDLTQLLFHMRCLDKDARPNITTNPLAAYQQHAVFNFKEGLDEKRLRQIETLLARPIGAKCGSANLKMTEIIGFRGASISHISRRTLWYAYSGSGMAAICILQKCSNSSLCGPKASHGSGLILEPYAVITASDIGVVRMWSWQGQALGQLSEDELMTAEEYSKSILSKDLSTILQEGTVFLNSNSIEYMNASGAEKGLAVDLGNSILAAEQVPYKSGRQSSISQKESTRGGWVFPEWQICRPASADKLPTVTPFLQLPRSFAPRMDLLREWATPQVKVQIKALADANKIMNTFGHSIVADENSSFLELIHLQIDGAKSSFAAIVNAPLQHSLDIKPAIQNALIEHEKKINDWDSVLSKPMADVGASLSIAGSGSLMSPDRVSNDVAKAVKEQRKLLTVNQLKRQNSQETWDRKIRFPNLNSEQLLREGTTAGREDMAIEGFRKEGAPSPSPEELDARLHKQAVALYDNKSNTLPRTLTGDKVTAIQQPFSAGVSLRSAPPTPMTPQLTMTATEVDRTARFNGAVTDRRPSLSKMTGEELRKKTLAVVSRQFSSNFEDAVENKSFHALPETQMSLQDIYLSQIRARTTMDNIIGERNGSFVSIAEDNERDILKMIKQKSKGAQSGTNTDGGIQRLDSDKLERQSTFSIEKPPLRFDEDLLDASAVQIAPMAGAPPPKPEVSVKMMLPRSGTSIGAGFFGKKRAEEFTNSKRKVSEVEYSDTDSDDSDGSSNNSHGQRKPFGMSLTPFGQAVGRGSKAPFFSDDISVPGRVEENVADTSRTPPSPISKPDRPVTAPAKKSNRQTDVSKIDNIIASIEEVQQGVATSYGPNRLRKSLNDAISISSGASNNEILFFNNRKPIETAQSVAARPRSSTADSSNLSTARTSEHPVHKSPLDMSALTATIERFDRLIEGEESTGHRLRTEEDAREKRLEAIRAKRRQDKQALNSLEADVSSAGDLSSRLPDSARGKGLLSKSGNAVATAPLVSERGRTRYGPYKAKDVHVFIEFIEQLDQCVSRLGHDKNDFSDAKSYLIGDVLSQQEILHRPKFNREISRIAAKQNSMVTLLDLLSVLFPYASHAEWYRMKTLCIGKRLVFDFLNALIEPVESAEERPRSPTKLFVQTSGSSRLFSPGPSTTHTPVAGTTPLDRQPILDASPIKSTKVVTINTGSVLETPLTRVNSVGNLPSTPGSRTQGVGKIPIRVTMSAWKIPYDAADDIRRALDLLFEVETGTLTGNDIVDIIQIHEKVKDLEPIKTLSRYMIRHGFNLQEEFNGQMFIEAVECVLQIEILKRPINQRNQRNNDTAAGNASYNRVRLLSTMIHNSDLKKTVGTSAIHAQSKLKLTRNAPGK